MKKLQVWLPLLFSLVLIAGMLVGSGLRQNIPYSKGLFHTPRRTPVQEVMDLVQTRYVDSINSDTLSEDAIQAMLAHLDPHSVYIPPSHVDEINEDLQGNFEGIGVAFYIIDDTVNVTNVLPGGPSDQAGLQVGDKFLKVNDSLVAGNNIDGDRIQKLLRGPGGSKVAVSLLRSNKRVETSITRGTIPLYAVDASYMIDGSTGFIHLNKFSNTTHKEFIDALSKLQQQGMKKLIFDLRGNGGGILQEAVEIADEFLDDNKLVVYTQGNTQNTKEYHCQTPGLFEKGKLVILTDESTASASEIVAGAMQDWDRATIIGRRTFGKGLVQEQYDLSGGGALRLTVARYYTPIGRNIQKPYDKGREAYNDELQQRYHDGELMKGDTVVNHKGTAYKTKGGRIVYGGGGITPDIFVPFDTATFSTSIYPLFDGQVFGKFIYTWYINHEQYFSQFKNPRELAHNFSAAGPIMNELINYAAKDSVQLKSLDPRDKAEIEKRIKLWMARQIWRMEGFYEVNNEDDPVIKKALDVLQK